MKEGDVVLTPLPQADSKVKNRPAVILRVMPRYGDLLVCGVSSQVHQAVAGFDETLQPGDSDFVGSGLKQASVIRLGFLVVLPAANFIGSIGAIGSERHERLLERLARYIGRTAAKE